MSVPEAPGRLSALGPNPALVKHGLGHTEGLHADGDIAHAYFVVADSASFGNGRTFDKLRTIGLAQPAFHHERITHYAEKTKSADRMIHS